MPQLAPPWQHGALAEAPAAEHNGLVVRKKAIVRGEVQGVGFRYYALHEATHLGLAGYVRNRGDGAVELELEGPEASVARMLIWLGHGPPSAVVDSLDVGDIPPLGETGFTITR